MFSLEVVVHVGGWAQAREREELFSLKGVHVGWSVCMCVRACMHVHVGVFNGKYNYSLSLIFKIGHIF